MSRAKVFTSILMVLILIALSGVSVWAAPGGAEPTATPTETPTPEPTETPTPEPTEEPTVHPVASALAEFFENILGLEDGAIMGYHEDGWGFGVIAQACWMSSTLYDPDAENNITPLDILEAKKSHNFSSITLPDGETATNWGQFKKAVLSSDKAKKNLGAIMSGRAEPMPSAPETEAAASQGKGKKGKGSDEEVGGSSAEPSGKGKSKGGKPETPPGQDKKGGGKGGGGGKKK